MAWGIDPNKHIMQADRNLGLQLSAIYLLLGALLLFVSRGYTETTTALLGLSVFLLGLAPSVVYLLDSNRPPIPLLPMAGVFYAVNFSLPVFAKDFVVAAHFRGISNYALLLTLTSVLLFFVTYTTTRNFFLQRLRPFFITDNFDPHRLNLLLWFLLGLNYLCVLFPILKTIPSFNSFIEVGVYIAYGMLFLLHWEKKLPNRQAILLFSILFLDLIMRLSSGALAQVLQLGLILTVAYWKVRKRIPFALLGCMILFFTILSPVKNEYRLRTWSTESKRNSSVFQKIAIYAEVFADHYLSTGSAPLWTGNSDTSNLGEQGAIYQTLHRVSMGVLFSEVVRATPHEVAFWQGETLQPLVTSFIPRIFWPGKPREDVANLFGRKYKFINPDDMMTSVNISWPTEFYGNFGELGLFLGMALIGVFFAFLESKFNRKQMGDLESVIGIVLLAPICWQESNFTLLCNNILLTVLAFFFYFRIGLLPSLPGQIHDPTSK